MATLTSQQFRADFPEFISTTNFPNGMVNFYINLSTNMLSLNKFGDQIVYAQELYVAHCITIESKAVKEAASGGIPGTMSGGIPSNKTVDKVSVSYDMDSVLDPSAGNWNLSIYGVRLWPLMKIFGSGPLFVGVGCSPALSGPAWTGPDCTPSQIGFGN